jgi:hypothetical protein
MKTFYKLKDVFELVLLVIVSTWILFALSTQLFFVYLHLSGQDERAGKISNEILWKLDGRFK